MDQAPKEKRHFFRHSFLMPLTLDVTGQKIPTRLSNISQGGVCFLWPDHLSKGALIKLQIPVKEKLFGIKGKVAYSREVNEHQYETGVAFLDSPNAFKARLAEEILQIVKYRKSESEKLGYELSEEEAAEKWIGEYAARFNG